MTNPCELVNCLLLFGGKLHSIGEALPFTAAALPEMLTNRLDPVRRRRHQPCRIAVDVTFAFAAHLHVHHVARHHARHEQHFAVIVGQCVAFGGDIFD